MTNALVSTTSSSSSSSTTSSGVLRITGMASGIDTDAVVKSMVSGYQTKIDKANQAQQTLQWKQEAYRDIIKGIKGLQEYFDPLSSKYILSGNSMNINSTTNSDSSKFSATASSSAKTGTYIVNTMQLATQAKVTGSSLSSVVKVKAGSGSEWNGATLTIDDTDVSLGSITDTSGNGSILDEVVNKINNNSTLNAKISASYVTDSSGSYIKFTNKSGTNDVSLKAATSNGSQLFSNSIAVSSSYNYNENVQRWSNANLTIGSTSIQLDTMASDATLDDVVANINCKISSNSTLSGKVTASSVTDSSGSYIKFINTSGTTMGLTATTSNNPTTLGSITSMNSGVSTSTKLISDLGFSAGTISFNVTSGTTNYPVSLTVDSSTTMQNLMDKVKSSTSGAVTMNVDDNTGQVSFQSKNYGSTANLTLTDTDSTLSKLGLSTNTTTAIGTDAIVSITAPGQSAVTTTQSSNKFTSNGVTYNLVDTGTASTTVVSNSDAVVANIKSFITDYNTIISTINTKLTEKKDSDYPPLTDSQKESMSDTEISAWEAKAKVGVLRNDDNLSSMMTQLRGIFSSSVYSNYDSSSSNSNTKISLSFGQYGTGSIGIDTSTDYTDGGKLVLQDESKLKDAIENNFDDFKKLFIGTSDNTLSTNQSYVGSSKYKEDGLFTRMSTILKEYVATPGLGEDGTYTLSGSMNIFVNKQYDYSSTGYSGKNTIPDQIYKQTVSIAKLKTQMSDAETRYYNKFSALESLMTTLSSQQSTLTSMLS